MFSNIQIRQIQCIGFFQGDAEEALEGVFDGLAAVDGDGVIVGRDDLDGHAGFDLHTVADLAAFGRDCEQSHRQNNAF